MHTETLRFTGHERDEHQSGGCSGTIQINDTTLSNGEHIIACDEISSENTTIAGTGEVTFSTAGEIVLGPGFVVEDTVDWVADIDQELQLERQDLDYMHARYASPWLGRFVSVDPKEQRSALKLPQKWNRYAYALNNPIKFLDPNGLEEITFQLSTFINQATVGRLFGNYTGGTKTYHQVTIETDRSIAGENPIVRQSKFVGETTRRSLFDSRTTVDRGQAATSGLTAEASFDAQGQVHLVMSINSANPLLPIAPPINVTLDVTVDPTATSFEGVAQLDGFPTTAAVAVTSDGQSIPIFVAEEGPSPVFLFYGLGDQEVKFACTTNDDCDVGEE